MLCVPSQLYASITIKISAGNPSRFTEREVSVKSYLPKGVRPEHVLDAGGLEVTYDVKREQTLVYKDITLGPLASTTFAIEIDDIWVVSETTLRNLEDKTDTLYKKLAGTEYAEAAEQLRKKIRTEITGIRIKQEASSASKVGPTGHIAAFEESKEALKSVEADIISLEQFFDATQGNVSASMIGGIKDREAREKILELGLTGEGNSCLVEKALEEEKEIIDFNVPRTVPFRIGVENPSTIESRSVAIKHFLVEEVRGRDVIDSGELKVGLDFEKNLYYVYADDVPLAPLEYKVFNITLKNKWSINKRKLYSSKVFIESIMRSAAKEELRAAQSFGKKAIGQIDELLKRPNIKELTEDDVKVFNRDKQKEKEINQSIQKMKDLLLEAGISVELSLVDQERACQEAKELGLGQKEMDEALSKTIVLEAQKEKVTSGSIFKGKSIATVSTWKIIAYIILFLGVISATFYFLSIREQKSAMFDVLTGAFTRGYALERFREEVKIAKGAGKKCSLLVMDVDKFKGVNDTHGHTVGDMILKEFVIAIRKGIRATDLIGRFGGDEFVIILPTSEKEMAYKIAKGICRTVEGTMIKVSPQLTLNITTSIGVATFPDDSVTAEDLFDKADKALYKVKKRGGNGAEMFGEHVEGDA